MSSGAGISTTLSTSDVEFFNANGYVGPFALCSPDEMSEWRERIVRDVLATHPPHNIREQSRHLDSRIVYDLCSHPAIVDRMTAILGPDLVLWRSNFFTKEPGGLEIPWHQDFGFWPIDPAINVSAWLAIDEATPRNSCVQLIPGSHKTQLPMVKALPGMAFDKMTDPAYVDQTLCLDMPLKPGEFFLFNECTLHHSNANTSDQRRMGLAVRVTVPCVKIDHDQIFAGHKAIQLVGRDDFKLNRMTDPPKMR